MNQFQTATLARLLYSALFVTAAVVAAANFTYAWTHPDVPNMEVLRRTPENLGEMDVWLLLITVTGATVAAARLNRRAKR